MNRRDSDPQGVENILPQRHEARVGDHDRLRVIDPVHNPLPSEKLTTDILYIRKCVT